MYRHRLNLKLLFVGYFTSETIRNQYKIVLNISNTNRSQIHKAQLSNVISDIKVVLMIMKVV